MKRCVASVPYNDSLTNYRRCKRTAQSGALVCSSHLPRDQRPQVWKHYIEINRKYAYYDTPMYRQYVIGKLFDTYEEAVAYMHRYWAHIVRPQKGKHPVKSVSVQRIYMGTRSTST